MALPMLSCRGSSFPQYFLGLEFCSAMCWLDQCLKVPMFSVFTSVKEDAGDTYVVADHTEEEDRAAPGSAEGSGDPDVDLAAVSRLEDLVCLCC